MQAGPHVKVEAIEPAEIGAAAAAAHNSTACVPNQIAQIIGRSPKSYEGEQGSQGAMPAGEKLLDIGMYWRPNVITRSATRSWSDSARTRRQGCKSSAASPSKATGSKCKPAASESEQSEHSDNGSEEDDGEREVDESNTSTDLSMSSSSTYSESSSTISEESGKNRKKPRRIQRKQRAQPASQNGRLRGVYEQGGRFRAQYCHQGLVHQLGMYVTEAAAGQAWDRVAWTYRGNQATLNFPRLISEYDTEDSKRTVRELMDERMSLHKDRGKSGKSPVVSTKKKNSGKAEPEPPISRRGAVRKTARSFIPPVDNHPDQEQVRRKRKRQASDSSESEDSSLSDSSSTVSESSDESDSEAKPSQKTSSADESNDNRSTENEKKSPGKQARNNNKLQPGHMALLAAQRRRGAPKHACGSPDDVTNLKKPIRKLPAALREAPAAAGLPSTNRPPLKRRRVATNNKPDPGAEKATVSAQDKTSVPNVGLQPADEVPSTQILLHGEVVKSGGDVTHLKRSKARTAPTSAKVADTNVRDNVSDNLRPDRSCKQKQTSGKAVNGNTRTSPSSSNVHLRALIKAECNVVTPCREQPDSGHTTNNVMSSGRPQRSRRPPKALTADYDSPSCAALLGREVIPQIPNDARNVNNNTLAQTPEAVATPAAKRATKAGSIVKHEATQQELVTASIVPALRKEVGKPTSNTPLRKPAESTIIIGSTQPGRVDCVPQQQAMAALCNLVHMLTNEAGGRPQHDMRADALQTNGHQQIETDIVPKDTAAESIEGIETSLRRSRRKPVRSTLDTDMPVIESVRPNMKRKYTKKAKQVAEPTAQSTALSVLAADFLAHFYSGQDSLQPQTATMSETVLPVQQTSGAGVQPATAKPQASSDSSPNANLRPASRWRKRRASGSMSGSPACGKEHAAADVVKVSATATRVIGEDNPNIGDLQDDIVTARAGTNLTTPSNQADVGKRPLSKRQRTHGLLPNATAAELPSRSLQPTPSSAIRNSLPSVHTAPVSSLICRQPVMNHNKMQWRVSESGTSTGMPTLSNATTSVNSQGDVQHAHSSKLDVAATVHVQKTAGLVSFTDKVLKDIKGTTNRSAQRVQEAAMPLSAPEKTDTALRQTRKACQPYGEADVDVQQVKKPRQSKLPLETVQHIPAPDIKQRDSSDVLAWTRTNGVYQEQQNCRPDPEYMMYATATIRMFPRRTPGAKPAQKNEVTPDSERTISNLACPSIHAGTSNPKHELKMSALTGSVSKACKPATHPSDHGTEHGSCAPLDLSDSGLEVSKSRRALHFTSPLQPSMHAYSHQTDGENWQHASMQGLSRSHAILDSGDRSDLTATGNVVMYGGASQMPYTQVHPTQCHLPGPAAMQWRAPERDICDMQHSQAVSRFGAIPGGMVGSSLQVTDAASARNTQVLAHLQQLRMLQQLEKQQLEQMHHQQLHLVQQAASVQQHMPVPAGQARESSTKGRHGYAAVSAVQAMPPVMVSSRTYMCHPVPVPSHMYHPALNVHPAGRFQCMPYADPAAMYQQQLSYQGGPMYHPANQLAFTNSPHHTQATSHSGDTAVLQSIKAERQDPDASVPTSKLTTSWQSEYAPAPTAGRLCNTVSHRGLGLSRKPETHLHTSCGAGKRKLLDLNHSSENGHDLSYDHASKNDTNHGRSLSSCWQQNPSPAKLRHLDQLADVAVMLQSQEEPDDHRNKDLQVTNAADPYVCAVSDAVDSTVNDQGVQSDHPPGENLGPSSAGRRTVQRGSNLTNTLSEDTRPANCSYHEEHLSKLPSNVSPKVVLQCTESTEPAAAHNSTSIQSHGVVETPNIASHTRTGAAKPTPQVHATVGCKQVCQPANLVASVPRHGPPVDMALGADAAPSRTAHVADPAEQPQTMESDILIVNNAPQLNADVAASTETPRQSMLPPANRPCQTEQQQRPADSETGDCHNNTSEVAQQSQPLTQSSPKTQPTDLIIERQQQTPLTQGLHTPATFAINGLHIEHNNITGNDVTRFIQMLHSSSEPFSTRDMPVIFTSNGSATTSSNPSSLQGLLQLLASPQVVLSQDPSPLPLPSVRPSPVGHPGVASQDITAPNWSQT